MPVEFQDDGALERLSADDEAQRTAALHTEAALYEHRLRAQRSSLGAGRPGRCANCLERCLPTAVYCDEDCRDDHEARERARLRGAAG
jgi:hypothetical protein